MRLVIGCLLIFNISLIAGSSQECEKKAHQELNDFYYKLDSVEEKIRARKDFLDKIKECRLEKERKKPVAVSETVKENSVINQ